jgi:hypothetical protein
MCVCFEVWLLFLPVINCVSYFTCMNILAIYTKQAVLCNVATNCC